MRSITGFNWKDLQVARLLQQLQQPSGVDAGYAHAALFPKASLRSCPVCAAADVDDFESCRACRSTSTAPPVHVRREGEQDGAKAPLYKKTSRPPQVYEKLGLP
jgi:hypothetical protein